MPIISVDVATRRYQDIGVAVLVQQPQSIEVTFVRPTDHGLTGPPDAQMLAAWIGLLAQAVKAPVITVDGPHAWKDPHNGLLHARVCERLLRTQAKTGVPGVAKPGTALRFVTFSVAFFDYLAELGWSRLLAPPLGLPLANVAVEVFPTAAWRALQLTPLPAKHKTSANDICAWLAKLQNAIPLTVNCMPTHDELQALVGGLSGLALAQGATERFQLVGQPPFLLDGSWREGYILQIRKAD